MRKNDGITVSNHPYSAAERSGLDDCALWRCWMAQGALKTKEAICEDRRAEMSVSEVRAASERSEEHPQQFAFYASLERCERGLVSMR